MNPNKILDGIYIELSNLNYKIFHIWSTQIVFNWRWWLGVILCFLPWIIWIKIRDKKNTVRLLFVGLVVMIISTFLDSLGISYDLWHYNFKVLPLVNGVGFPWDYALLPVGIMLILQLKPQINVYIKAVIFAFCTAFIIEPFFVWISMYDIAHWKYQYSCIIYFFLYLLFSHIYKSKLFNTPKND
jgi:hypothetical protein